METTEVFIEFDDEVEFDVELDLETARKIVEYAVEIGLPWWDKE